MSDKAGAGMDAICKHCGGGPARADFWPYCSYQCQEWAKLNQVSINMKEEMEAALAAKGGEWLR